jgi:hypothetical protein
MGGTIPPLVTAVGGGVGAAAVTGASAASRAAACLRRQRRSYTRKTLSLLLVLFRTFFFTSLQKSRKRNPLNFSSYLPGSPALVQLVGRLQGCAGKATASEVESRLAL